MGNSSSALSQSNVKKIATLKTVNVSNYPSSNITFNVGDNFECHIRGDFCRYLVCKDLESSWVNGNDATFYVMSPGLHLKKYSMSNKRLMELIDQLHKFGN